ncbi:MAG: hypothetical protein ABUS79_19280 [Pseudomonadota bacterium]
MREALAGWGRFAWLLALLAVGSSAAAQQEEAPRLQVFIAADPAVSESVSAVLRDSLSRRGLAVDAIVVPRIDPLQLARPSAGGTQAAPVARVWLDLVAPQPTMYFVTEPTGLVYVRPLAVHPAPDNVELELIRFVVDGAVQAILEGQPLGVPRAEFERSLAPPVVAPPPPPAPAPLPPRPRPKWVVAAAYSGTRLSAGVVAHGPGLAAELLWPRLRLGVGLLQRLPVTVSSPEVSAELLSSGVRLFAAVPARVTARLWASAGVGAGVDLTRVTPAGSGATPPFWVSDPLVLGIATVQQTLGRIVAAADAGVDFDLIAPRYAVIRSGQTVGVWTPARWRPFATARLGIAF